MSDQYANDTMLEMYLFETSQNIEQLELCILESEKSKYFTAAIINEIFRMMHTIKGSSAMMLFNNISILAHSMEDLIYFLREHNPQKIDFHTLSNLILEGVDYIKVELHKIKSGETANGDVSQLINKIRDYLSLLKGQHTYIDDNRKTDSVTKHKYYITPSHAVSAQRYYTYKATIFFEHGCEMENIRAYTIVHNLKEFSKELTYIPSDIIDNDDCVEEIRETGFKVFIKT